MVFPLLRGLWGPVSLMGPATLALFFDLVSFRSFSYAHEEAAPPFGGAALQGF